MIKNISIILVDVQLPENIGLTARAMFNFGIPNLILVNPKIDLPSEKAEAVAVDALDLVKNAKVYDELREALDDFTYSFAFTATSLFSLTFRLAGSTNCRQVLTNPADGARKNKLPLYIQEQ